MVEVLAVVAPQVLEQARVVVQPERTGMTDAERVEEIGHRDPLGDRRRAFAADLVEAARFEMPSGGDRMEGNVIRYQRVHPVDGDELLSQ